MWNYNDQSLCHYGVLGMKWGHRKTPEYYASKGKQSKADKIYAKSKKRTDRYKGMMDGPTEKSLAEDKEWIDLLKKTNGHHKKFEGWFDAEADWDEAVQDNLTMMQDAYDGAKWTYDHKDFYSAKVDSIDINSHTYKEVKEMTNDIFNEYISRLVFETSNGEQVAKIR